MPEPFAPSPLTPLDDEDAKLVTLARAARARLGTPEAAAVRDETGRTYVATTVELPSLSLGALAGAVVAAVSSGARALEAAAVVTEAPHPAEADLAPVRDLGGPAVTVVVAGPDGAVRAVLGQLTGQSTRDLH